MPGGRVQRAILVHADQLDAAFEGAFSSKRGHYGVRVAVHDEGVDVACPVQRQAGAVADRAGPLEFAVLVHADELDAVSVPHCGQCIGVAVAQGERCRGVGASQAVESRAAVLRQIHIRQGAVAVHAEQLHVDGGGPADQGVRAAVAQAERGHCAAVEQALVCAALPRLRARRGQGAVLAHADQLDAVIARRGHQGVRVAVAKGKHFDRDGLAQRVVCAAAGILRVVERRAGRLEGAVLVHADKLDGIVSVRDRHGIRVAVAEGECLYVDGVSQGRKSARAVDCPPVAPHLHGPVLVHADQLDRVAQAVVGRGPVHGRDDVRIAVAQCEGVYSPDRVQIGIVIHAAGGHHVGGQQGRRPQRKGRVDHHILGCGKRAWRTGGGQLVQYAVAADRPAVEREGSRARIVQVCRAVALPHLVVEDERGCPVARCIVRRAAGTAARVQLERRHAVALVDVGGPVEVDGDRYDRVHVGDRVRAVHVVVRGRDGHDGGRAAADGDPAALA